MRRSFLPTLLGLLAATATRVAAQTPALDTAAVLASARPEIDAANRDWVTGFRRHDPELIAAAYADSGLFIGPDGGVTLGRAAVRRMYQSRLSRVGVVRDGAVIRDGFAVVGPSSVYEWGHGWLDVESSTPGGPPVRSGGSYLTVWHRERDGHWRIVRNLAL